MPASRTSLSSRHGAQIVRASSRATDEESLGDQFDAPASRRPSVTVPNSWLKEYISRGIAFNALPDEELDWIETRTGMNHLQIRKWFQNKRNRMRVAGDDVPPTHTANKNAFSSIYKSAHPGAGQPRASRRRRSSVDGSAMTVGRTRSSTLTSPPTPSTAAATRRMSLPGFAAITEIASSPATPMVALPSVVEGTDQGCATEPAPDTKDAMDVDYPDVRRPSLCTCTYPSVPTTPGLSTLPTRPSLSRSTSCDSVSSATTSIYGGSDKGDKSHRPRTLPSLDLLVSALLHHQREHDPGNEPKAENVTPSVRSRADSEVLQRLDSATSVLKA